MTNVSRRALLAASPLVPLGLAGCVSSDPDSVVDDAAGSSLTPADGGTLRYAIWSNPNGTFHPLLYFTDYDRAVVFTVYSRLVIVDEKQDFIPSLAEKYEYSDDGRTLTFTLRTGVTWHDGEPFTADDVAFTYTAPASGDYPLDTPEFSQRLAGFKDYNSGKKDTLEGIKVVDDSTVSFTFDEPFGSALSYFADRPVLAQHVWKDTPVAKWNEATKLLNHPVGTGPFAFDEFVSDQYVSLKRNDDYFGGAPKLSQFIFKVSNTETAQTDLLNGELDIAELSSWNQTDLDTYADGDVKIIEQTGVSAQYLTLDSQNEKLKDPLVRQALVYGIDRQGLIDGLLYGHGDTFNSNAHPEDPFYPDDLEEYAFDQDKAKDLLAKAGWKADGDGILEKDGEKFTFTLNFPTGNKTREQSAPIIQQNLQDLGIKIELASSDFNSTLAILQDESQRYDGVLMGGTFRPGEYDNNFWWERYESDELTELSDGFNTTIDADERKELVGKWITRINEVALQVWLYIPSTGFAVAPGVSGFEPYPYEPFAGANGWSVSDS
jgi:peptide/nickel transport system substrate-binding protein